MSGFISGLSIQFYWSVSIFFCQYYAVLLTITSKCNLKLGIVVPPALLFGVFVLFCFFRIVLGSFVVPFKL